MTRFRPVAFTFTSRVQRTPPPPPLQYGVSAMQVPSSSSVAIAERRRTVEAAAQHLHERQVAVYAWGRCDVGQLGIGGGISGGGDGGGGGGGVHLGQLGGGRGSARGSVIGSSGGASGGSGFSHHHHAGLGASPALGALGLRVGSRVTGGGVTIGPLPGAGGIGTTGSFGTPGSLLPAASSPGLARTGAQFTPQRWGDRRRTIPTPCE
jgi:hypothetical protein